MKNISIAEYIEKVYIVQNAKDIDQLRNCLEGENREVEVIRRDYTQ